MTLGDFSGADFLHWAKGSQEKAEAQNGELLAKYNASVFYEYIYIYIHALLLI